MKKISCMIMVLILSISYTLISQDNVESFLTFTEEMQYNDMESSISWFRKNKYDFDKHKIDENVFDFYRGVARFSSYQVYHGAASELRLCIQDFYKVLTSGTSYNENYSDRSLLYIAAALMELRTDKEVSARILQYFVDNTPTNHPYYTTALFWQTYLRFLNASTYTYNYDTLLELSENRNVLVYDYSTASTKSLSQIMNKLDTPEEVTLQQYKWTRDSTDIITLIKSVIVNENIYDNPNIPKKMAKEQRYVKTDAKQPEGIPKPTIVPIPEPGQVEKPNPEPKDNEVTTTPPIRLKASDLADFRLIVEKNDDDIPIKIQIAGETITTRKSQKYTVYINAGEYNIVSTYNKKSYTNSIIVNNDKTNILTIIAKSPTQKESYVRFIITLDSIRKDNNSKNYQMAKSQNNETINKIKNLLLQDPSLAIRWFNINYYSANMDITPEEYSYYRGIAYYKQFLKDKNPLYAAQAKYDFEFVYEKKEDIDTIINTEIYLANIEAYAYGNYNDAERFLASATKRIEGTDYTQYLPTIAYWRVRIGAINAKEAFKLKEMLLSKAKTTPIMDMKTGKYQILSIMYPQIDSKISILPASRVTAKAFLSHPEKNAKLVKASEEVRNIPIYINTLGEKNNTTIQFTSINDNKHQIPYSDNLFLGSNKLAINWGNQVFYIDIDTKQNESYSILLISN